MHFQENKKLCNFGDIAEFMYRIERLKKYSEYVFSRYLNFVKTFYKVGALYYRVDNLKCLT